MEAKFHKGDVIRINTQSFSGGAPRLRGRILPIARVTNNGFIAYDVLVGGIYYSFTEDEFSLVKSIH